MTASIHVDSARSVVAGVVNDRPWRETVVGYVSEDDSKIIKPCSIFGSGEPEGDAAKFQLMDSSTVRAGTQLRSAGSGVSVVFSIKLTNFLIPKRSNEVTKLGTTPSGFQASFSQIILGAFEAGEIGRSFDRSLATALLQLECAMVLPL
ncbi:hypothetical protein B0H14DRAFT_2584743 [Mycena olivaceomarginata]|nr:hypothetical protein B0H14DRAFT_2584743 [Mycena olivaceomarginata]